jgi:hypothetical protein
MAKFDRDGGTRLTMGIALMVMALLDLDGNLPWWLRATLIAVGLALSISGARMPLEDMGEVRWRT